MRLKIECKTIIIFIIAIIFYLSWIAIFYDWGFNIFNVIIYIGALLLVLYGRGDYKINGVTPFSLFLISFNSVLLFNCFNFAGVQQEKNILDLYYFFFGPCIFAMLLRSNHLEKKVNTIIENVESKNLYKIEDDFRFLRRVIIILWITHLFLRIYIYKETGIRFFSSQWSFAESQAFVISGISGLAQMLLWVCLMFVPIFNKMWGMLIGLTSVIIPLLDASRGDLMRVLAILMFVVLYGNRKEIELKIEKRERRLIVILGSLILALFVIMGLYRNQMRNSPTNNMGMALESRIDNVAFNWIYGYTGVNFDVLKDMYTNIEPSGHITLLLTPFIRFIYGSEVVMIHREEMFYNGLNGINAPTFLGTFVQELGCLYFVDIIILGLVTKTIYVYSMKKEFKGGIIMVLASVLFAFYGCFLTSTTIIYAIIFSILLYNVMRKIKL